MTNTTPAFARVGVAFPCSVPSSLRSTGGGAGAPPLAPRSAGSLPSVAGMQGSLGDQP